MSTRDRWDPDRMMNGWDGDMMDGSGVWVMVLVTVLLVALVATVLVVVVRAASPTAPPPTLPGMPGAGPPTMSAPLTARDVLDLRLARGEITRAQYAEMRHDLGL